MNDSEPDKIFLLFMRESNMAMFLFLLIKEKLIKFSFDKISKMVTTHIVNQYLVYCKQT